MFIRHRQALALVRRVYSCPGGLKRYYGTGSLHFITWSCYRRKPLLGNPARRDLVLTVLDLMRVRYRFAVIGYVVMPEHVHLLISEPLIGDPSKIIQAAKLSVSRRLAIRGGFSGRFWQSRFYDFGGFKRGNDSVEFVPIPRRAKNNAPVPSHRNSHY